MNKWFTADWHIGEDRMEIMQRPFTSPQDMLDTLVENHNRLVKPDDEVYVVGDAVYQKADPSNLEHIAKFNGRKILFRGNHDRVFDDFVLSKYFDKIYQEREGLDIVINDIPCWVIHYPVLGKKDKFNIVGHIHGNYRIQLNMLNVGVDAHHFLPVNFDKISFYHKAICEYYDEDAWIAYNEINSSYQGLRGKKGSYIYGS